MHWYIPTEVEDANEGGTFFQNACLREGRHSEDPSKITCKGCAAIYAYPGTPAQMAAKLVQLIVAEQEEGRKSDFSIEVKCNSCESDVDVFGWYESVTQHVEVAKMIHFLGHVAYDHAWGSEVMVIRHYTPIPVYALNFAMGKPAQTDYEASWREREGLVCR
jgi:ribosomal protein S27E